MRRFVKPILGTLGGLAIIWLAFSWFEAGKEIRILCSGFHPGMEREHVLHVLDTGDYLRYSSEADPDAPISIDSLYNLRSTRCVIEFDDGQVLSATHE